METTYHIIVDITTTKGLLEVGSFYLGNDVEFATTTFDNLMGMPYSNDAIIRMSLVETGKGALPKTLNGIGCILNEYAENCKIITRDVFKYYNLKK